MEGLEMEAVTNNASNENMTTDPTLEPGGPSPTATMLGAAVMLLFFVEGVIGNMWILFAVLSRRSMWNIINLFIASLCFNELLTAGLIVVLIIDSYIWHQWTAGVLMCKLNPEFTIAFTGCSLWHTAFIAIHRYIVVCHNDAYKQMSKTAYVTFVLVVARLIPFACTFPGFNLQTSGYVPKLLRCILLPDQGTRIVTITMVQIILPCIIVILCYALVFCYVMKVGRQVTNSNFIQQREIQITKMFGVIFFMILLGFVPYAVVRNADKSNQLNADIYVIVTVFYGIATCSSPLIYGAMSTEIRNVCMSCIAQCFCLLKCTPCERLRHQDRMLSLSQMADADVSPASNSRDVQVQDATTQIENGAVHSKANKTGHKHKPNGCDVMTEQEIEPLHNRSRCFSIEEDDEMAKEADAVSLRSVCDNSKEAQEKLGIEVTQDTTGVDIPLAQVNQTKNSNNGGHRCSWEEKDSQTQNGTRHAGSVPVTRNSDKSDECQAEHCDDLCEQETDTLLTDNENCTTNDDTKNELETSHIYYANGRNSQLKEHEKIADLDISQLNTNNANSTTDRDKVSTEVILQPGSSHAKVSLFKLSQRIKHAKV